jgi:hypothetical protein
VALVDDPGQPARAGQDGQERHLRERHGRVPVVDEQDVLGGQGQLVAATRGGAVDGGQPVLPGVGGGVLDGAARLVGELAEVDLGAVGGDGQHPDVGAGAEDLVLAPGDDHGAHLGVLEAQPLHGVVELDVDREVVGVELELVLVGQTAPFVDVKCQSGDRWLDGELPVPVAVRVGIEGDGGTHD